MKNDKKLITIITVFLLASFVVTFFLASYLLYIPSLFYDHTDTDFLNDYFTRITQEPVYSIATDKFNYYYDDTEFSYGDVIKELAQYTYTPVSLDDALPILKTEALDETAYQVQLHLYSDELNDLGVVNAVYFSYEGYIYTLVFLDNTRFVLSDNTNTGDFYTLESYVEDLSAETTLYISDMKEYPDNITAYCFDNHGLISSWFKSASTISKNKAAKIALVTVTSESILIAVVAIALRKKCCNKVRNK